MAEPTEKQAGEFASGYSTMSFEDGVKVMKALAHGSGEDGFTDADLTKAIDAIHAMRVGAVIVEMVFKGEMLIVVRDGEVRYVTAPDFNPERAGI